MHDTQTIQLVLTAVAACALMLQTIFMIVVTSIVIKAVGCMREKMETYCSSVMPIIEKTRQVVENVAPKIEKVADELAALTKSLSKQTAEIQAAANDVIHRTRHQAIRVDSILTAVFDRLERAGVVLSDAVAKPMRQLSGLIASVKAAVNTLCDPGVGQRQAPRPLSPRVTNGERILRPLPTGGATPFRP